jgi:hypothetical protein
MHNTKIGNRTHNLRGYEVLTIGERNGNVTSQRHYHVEYPQDLNCG